MNRLVPIAMHMGYVGEAGSTVIEETEESLSTLQEFLKSIAPSLQTLLFKIIASIVIYIVGKKLIAIALKILEKFLSHTNIDVGVSKFLLSAARMAMYVLLAFVIVGQLGVNTASIVTLLGTAGGSLANVAGGILILLMKPFKVGDYVMTKYGDGTVRTIGLVYTVLTTIDNRTLTIPNGELSNSAVFDASAMTERRLDIAVGISYDSDILKAKKIMEEVYQSCPGFLADKDLTVHVAGLGDSSVTIEGFGWVKGSEYLKSKWYVLEEVKLRYDAEGIQIPFPQVDVHMKV